MRDRLWFVFLECWLRNRHADNRFAINVAYVYSMQLTLVIVFSVFLFNKQSAVIASCAASGGSRPPYSSPCSAAGEVSLICSARVAIHLLCACAESEELCLLGTRSEPRHTRLTRCCTYTTGLHQVHQRSVATTAETSCNLRVCRFSCLTLETVVLSRE